MDDIEVIGAFAVPWTLTCDKKASLVNDIAFP